MARDDRYRDDDRERSRGREDVQDERRGRFRSASELRGYYEQERDDAKRRMGSQGQFLTVEEGENRLRIVPPPWEGEPFFYKLGIHFGLGPESRSAVYCPPMTLQDARQECPVCDFVKMVRTKSQKSNELALAKRIACRARAYCVVVDRNKESDGFQIWTFGPRMIHDLLEYITTEYSDLLDIERGFDLLVKRVGKGLDTKYTVMPARNPSRIDLDRLGYPDSFIDLANFVRGRMLDADELHRVLEGEEPSKVVADRDEGESAWEDNGRGRGREREERVSVRERERDEGERGRREDEPRGRREEEPRGRREREPREEEERSRERDEPRGRREREPEEARPRARERDDVGPSGQRPSRRGDEKPREREDEPRGRRDVREEERPREREREREDERPRGRERDRDDEPRGRERDERRYDDAAGKELQRLRQEARGESRERR